jgi:hypothetical protein
MMVKLLCTLTPGSDDEGSLAESSDLLVPQHFGSFLAEIVNTLESGRDPGRSGRSGLR